MIVERLCAFVSSRMQELAAERRAIKAALDDLEVDAWVFEEDAGARAGSIQQTYRDQLTAADLYVGILWRELGAYTLDEYELAAALGKDRLIYLKGGGSENERAPELQSFLDRLSKVETGVTVRWFSTADELRAYVKKDVARWQTDVIRVRQSRAAEFRQQAPTLSDQYIVRPAIMTQLKALLSDPAQKRATRAVLHGAAGVGKTVVAAAFAREAELPRQFPDGVLWATVGRDGNPLESLTSWGRSLRDPAMSDLGYASLDVAIRQLRSLLQPRACLLVVDDAWSGTLVREAFLLGGPRCALLITTRHIEVADEIGAQIVEILPMQPDEAFALLCSWAGTMQPDDERIARSLADDLGFLPLALELLGAQARKRGSWVEVKQSLERQRLHALRRSRSASGKYNNLEDSFDLSVALLTAADRDLYLRLAAFEKRVQFPSSAAAALWGLDLAEAEDLLLDLSGQALLVREGREGVSLYSFQNLMHDFITDRLGPNGVQQAHLALVKGYRERCSVEWPSVPDDGYIYQHLAYHLAGAGQRDQLFALIDRAWMEASLQHTGTLRSFMNDAGTLLDTAAGEPVAMEEMMRACLIRATVRAVAENIPVSVVGALARLGEVERALGFAGLTRSDQQVNALCEIAEVLTASGNLGQANEISRHASEIVARARQAEMDDDELDGAACRLLAGRWEGADNATFRAALAASQPVSDVRRRCEWTERAGWELLRRGMAPAALVIAQEALRIAESNAAEPRLKGSALLLLARARTASGDRVGGQAAAEEARAIAADVRSPMDRLSDLASVADAFAEIGQNAGATAIAEEVLAGCMTLGEAWLDGDLPSRLHRDFQVAGGNPMLAEPLLRAARALLTAADGGDMTTARAVALLQAELAIGRSWQAQQLAQTMVTLAKSGSPERANEAGLFVGSVFEGVQNDVERGWLVPTVAAFITPSLPEPVARAFAQRLFSIAMTIDNDALKTHTLLFLDKWLGDVDAAAGIEPLLDRVSAGGDAEQLQDVAYILVNLGRPDEAAAVAGRIVEREPREQVLAVLVGAMIAAGRVDAAAAIAVGIESPEEQAGTLGKLACARISTNDTSRARSDVAAALRASLAARAWDWTESEGMVQRQVVGAEHAKGTSLAALAVALAEVGAFADAERVAGLIDEKEFLGQRMSALGGIASVIAQTGDREGGLRVIELARALESEDRDTEPSAEVETAVAVEAEQLHGAHAEAATSLMNGLKSAASRAALRNELEGRTTLEEEIGDSLRRTIVVANQGRPSVAAALLDVGRGEEAVQVATQALDAILPEDPDWDAFAEATEVLGRAGDAERLERARAFVEALGKDSDRASLLAALAKARAALGDTTGAASVLDEQTQLTARFEQPFARAYFTMKAADAAFAARDPRAGTFVSQATELANAHLDDGSMVALLQYAVDLLTDAGDSGRANATAQDSIAAAKRTVRPADLASAAAALAKVGQRDQAIDALSAALRAARDLNRVELFELTSSVAEALSRLREPDALRGLSAAIDSVDRWWTDQVGE